MASFYTAILPALSGLVLNEVVVRRTILLRFQEHLLETY